jgi:CelD/BcsL family acetyltransferase involved in cellulose biosynthesis
MKTITTEQIKEILQELKYAFSKTGLQELKRELGHIRQDMSGMITGITYKGRPIRNDYEKTAVVAILLAAVASAPTLIPLHFLLLKLGRKGFRYDKITKINLEAFQKRD